MMKLESLELYRAITSSMSEGVVLQDKNGVVIDMNQSAEQILEVPRQSFIGMSSKTEEQRCIKADGSLFPGDEHPSMVTLKTGLPCSGVIMGLVMEGYTKWININSAPVIFKNDPTPAPHAVVATFSDVTVQQNVLKSLRLAALGEAALNMGHEINNPLAVMFSKISRIKDELVDIQLPEQVRRCLMTQLHEVQKQGDRIQRIMAGMSVFSQQAENIAFQKVVLQDVVEEALEMVKNKTDRLNVPIFVHMPETQLIIYGHAIQLVLVISNLLNNALLAAARSSMLQASVTLSLTAVDGSAEFCVKNPGGPIPKSIQHRLFEPFVSSKDPSEGSGLGLAICKKIVDHHHGRIWYTEREDEGYVYFFVRFSIN